MTDAAAAAPLAYWTGYAAVVLVSAGAIRPWTVTVYNTESADSPGSAERKSMIFPRRWLDIYGRKLSEVWEAALRAVLGLVLLRPGISQVSVAAFNDGCNMCDWAVADAFGLDRRTFDGDSDQYMTGMKFVRCCRCYRGRGTSLHELIVCTRHSTAGLLTKRKRSSRSGPWRRRVEGVGIRCSVDRSRRASSMYAWRLAGLQIALKTDSQR